MKAIKYKILGLCICLFMMSHNGFSQKKKAIAAPTSYTIEGTISGLTDGTEVKLIPGATHSSELPVAETTLKEGKFTFTGKLNEPRFFYVVFGKNKGNISVMVENSKIKITATGSVSDKEGERISFKDVVVTGSKSNDYYKKETAFREELEKDYAAYHTRESDELSKLIGAARRDKNTKAVDSLQNLPVWKKFEADEKAFFTKVEKTTLEVISKHKATWWGPFFMMTNFSYFTPEQKPLYDQFSDAAKKSYYGQILDKDLNPKSLIGTSVANFSLKDKDGKPYSAKDIVAGKKYILVDFWASWCGPCRKEIPNLKTAYTEYAEKGFEILSISIDNDEKAWQKALAQENMKWHNLLDDDKVSKAFNVKAIPATYLVDSKGVIISDNLRGAELEAKLKELLKS